MNSKDRLERTFRNLPGSEYSITSPMDKRYNCIAWAAHEDFRNWWTDPDPDSFYYWPEGIERQETVEAFIKAYGTLGYEQCEDGEFKQGFEKIAIFG